MPPYSVEMSCATLREHGLDNSLYDLLCLVHGSSVEEIVNHLGALNFAAKTRATMQLRTLKERFLRHFVNVEADQVMSMEGTGTTTLT